MPHAVEDATIPQIVERPTGRCRQIQHADTSDWAFNESITVARGMNTPPTVMSVSSRRTRLGSSFPKNFSRAGSLIPRRVKTDYNSFGVKFPLETPQ